MEKAPRAYDAAGSGSFTMIARRTGRLPGALALACLLGAAGTGARASAAPPGPAEGSAPQGEPGPTVHIEVEGRRPTEVVLRATALDLRPRRWGTGVDAIDEEVCRAPCDEEVEAPEGASFYVSGHKLSRSSSFTLPPQGAVTLQVRPRRRAVVTLGWVMAALGGAATIGGATTMIVAGEDDRLLAAGGITLAVGLPVALTGILVARFVRTRVDLRR